MMIFSDFTENICPFLHDAVVVIRKRYSLESIYMDREGGIAITLKGKLSEDAIKDVLQNISPKDFCKDEMSLDYSIDYSYSDDMQKTHVYSADGIDYRAL